MDSQVFEELFYDEFASDPELFEAIYQYVRGKMSVESFMERLESLKDLATKRAQIKWDENQEEKDEHETHLGAAI